jgi:hypothetical protein
MSEPTAASTSPAAALVRLAKAEVAMRGHRGAPAGEAYDRKLAEWRSAYGAAVRLGRQLSPKEPTDADDAG